MTQNQLIREHLESGKGISPVLALNLFGCFRLASRIAELRKEMTIYGKMIKHGRRTYKVYYLKNSPLFDSYGVSF